jgi:hypothetical protein
MRRGLLRQSTTEVPFGTIKDVALEVSVSNSNNGSVRAMTYRPVFVTSDDARVPWTPISTSDRASQAKAVAAARAMGGWNALPVEGSPAIARALGAVRNLGCLYAFAAIFAIFGLFMMGAQLVPLVTWQPTPATVLASDIASVQGSKGGVSWKPVVTYRYTVGGAEYTSRRFAPLTVSASQGWAESMRRRYEPGAEVTAWYNPKHPTDAFIDHSLSWLPLLIVGVMALIVLAIVSSARKLGKMNTSALAGGDVPVLAAR